MKTLNEYQTKAMAFRLKNADAMYAFLNLASEAGEVCSLVAKKIRDGVKDPVDYHNNMKKELGDVMWMVAAIASDHNISLSEICENNIQKLADRKKRNTISGSGDNR